MAPLHVPGCMDYSSQHLDLGIIVCISFKDDCLIVGAPRPLRRCLSITAVAGWLFSTDSWWSLEDCSSSLTGETEALQCHCFWMNLTVVGESASCQNIWERPHTAFRMVIVGYFRSSCLDSSFICMPVSLLCIDFSLGLEKTIVD